MSTLEIASTAGWTYNGTGNLTNIGTYTNPDNSQKIKINSLTIYLGTVRGTCNTGTTATGNGSAFYTYIYINNIKSNLVEVKNVVGTLSSSKGSYPNRSETQPYSFTFSSDVIVNAGSSFTIKIKTPTSADSQVMALNGDKNNKGGQYMTLNYDSIPNISPVPSNLNLRVNSFGADAQNNREPWANCTVSANSVFTDFIIYYIANGISYDAYKNSISSGTTAISNDINIKDTICELYVKAKNNNSNWVESNHVIIDCTRPTVSELSLKVISSNVGTLYFKSDFNINYTFLWPDGYSGNPGEQSSFAVKNVYINKNVQLIRNTIEQYYLILYRESTPGNYNIGNSYTITNINTQLPNITLTGELFGTTLNFRAVADRVCNDWRYTLKNTSTGTTLISPILTSGTSSITGVLSQLEPNVQYIIEISAKDKNSNLTGYSNEITFKTTGCSRIFTKGQWKTAKVYIFNKNMQSWRAAVPYVYNSINKRWDICK